MNKKLSTYTKENNVTYRTAWNRFNVGKIPNAYQDENGTIRIKEVLQEVDEKIVIYCRVSSSQNKDNLETQSKRLLDYCSAKGMIVEKVVKEIGSGLNDNRPKLIDILKDETITTIVVEHKDRLTRFGFNYINSLLSINNRNIVVINNTDDSKEDLIQDFISVITSFCARIYGNRCSKRLTEKITKELYAEAIKVRIYPSVEQQHYLSQLFGNSRVVWNKCLEYKKQQYDKDKTNISFGGLGKFITDLKKTDKFNWLNNSHSKVLQQSIKNLDTAYNNFFRGKGKVGFPKFKNKSNNQSVQFRKDAISKNFINGNRLNLITDLKNILFKCSIKDEVFLNKKDLVYKSATLSKTKTGKYYLSILVEREHQKIKENNNSIGIDLGIKEFLITSEGETIENKKFKRNNQKKLNKLHKQLSRKKLGSSNRNKARLKLARFYEKLNNQKEYFLHQTVNMLINDNQVICIEDLNVKGMMSNHKLARSVQELSLYRFKQILSYKCNWNEKHLIEIDRWFASSKTCSNCGNKKDNLTLKDRVYNCSSCGYEIDRDINAAINIHNEGIRIYKNKIGMSCTELTPLESSSLELSMKKEKTGFL